MTKFDTPSAFARFGGLFLFLAMAIACFSWFTWSGYNIIAQLMSTSEVINFDKGSLYMLGAGIGLATLTFAIFYEGILRRNLTKKITKIITRTALAGVSLMFILPHLIHYPINQYLVEREYFICTQVSYQWLLYKKIVYTNNQNNCEALARQKEIIKNSSGL